MNRTLIALLGLTSVVLVGCGDGYEDYYTNRSDPTIGDLSPAEESGNTGGELVTIQGAGFGTEIDQVVVLIDNHNAEILSVADGEIQIRTPGGPVTGGPVDLLVATGTGWVLSEGAYSYGSADFATVDGDFYSDQEHYIQVTNVFNSCYGGIGAGLNGCQNSAFIGQTGIDGDAQFLRFAYPRLHSLGQGFTSGFDVSTEGWRVATPATPFANGIDDLRLRLRGGFRLINPEYLAESVCIDLNGALSDSPTACTDDTVAYDLGVMNWCETQSKDDGGSYEYEPDWPVNHDFFAGADPTLPVDITLEVPVWNLSKVLPIAPNPDFQAELGFDVDDGVPWSVSPFSECFDGNEDGESLLDEAGVTLSWSPVDLEALKAGDDVIDVNTYVHVSLSLYNFAWYGLEQKGVRVSAVFADGNDSFQTEDDETRSSLTIPNSVLYQLPDPNGNWSSLDNFSQTGSLGEYDDNPSYLFLEVYRVTDYKVQTPEGPMIFSYSTGEFSIANWSNPATADKTCGDCIDDDGDGWVDGLDPDCSKAHGGDGSNETNASSVFTCNDGIDNDENGLIDSDDPLCQAGWDGETTCGDGLDNDGDGWIDAADPDCIGGDAKTQESGDIFGQTTCNDGIDNDGDGWIDAQDPACGTGLDSEDDGYLGTDCNDGEDSDGHGDPDHLDIMCLAYGAESDSEAPPAFSRCVNGKDDDGDGFFDTFDPDCEYKPHNKESATDTGPANADVMHVPECYDGVDNDGDGVTDADDSSCWNPDAGFAADGFFNNEGASHGTGCTDGVDEDGDGWIDGADPDCVAGDPSAQIEVGLGDTECNDGIDNDGDGKIDSDDERCSRASINYEGPR